MIRMNVDEQQLETGIGLEKVVQKIIWYQIFWKDAIGKDIRLIDLQYRMYNSDLIDPFYLDRKLKLDLQHNLVKPLVDTSTSTFLGRVPDIVVNGTEAEKERASTFSLYQKHNEFEEEIYDTALNMGKCGSGFLGLYNEEGDSFPKYRSLDPRYTNVVYDCSIAMKRLFAYHIYYECDQVGRGRYVCLIYTKTKIYAYYTGQISVPTRMAFKVYPLDLFLINGSVLSYTTEHGFKDIPIIEFQNNKLCISDCKPALPQIALYSALQNNRFQNVDDIMNYLLFIKNARLGDEKEAREAISLIKEYRVLPLEGDNVDARFLSNPLNQTDIQKLSDDYKKEIHYITHIPDFTSVEFTQNASDPILKAKTKPLLDLCNDKEKWFNKGYMILLDLTLDFVYKNDKKLYDKVKFDLEKIDLVYTHTLPSNDIDTINAIVNLSNAGLCNPEVLLQGVSMIPNVNDYIKGMRKYNEYVDMRKKTTNNKNNESGVNETNLERQNASPQTKAQEDNMKNATVGQAQKISDNKAE
ncbi:MAG: phage portal protein [Methanobrevibacter sp.]|nr:phage portal protein [Methanobrevibacter sp.]